MLKKVRDDDLDDLMQFWKNEVAKYDRKINNENFSQEYTKVKNILIKNISSTIIYTEDGVINGVISIDKSNSEVELIIIKREIRREGIGSILIENYKKEHNELKVKIDKGNSIAIKFFEHNGFKVIRNGSVIENKEEGKNRSLIEKEEEKNESIIENKEEEKNGSIIENKEEGKNGSLIEKEEEKNGSRIEKKENIYGNSENLDIVYLEWNKNERKTINLIYFDNSIDKEEIIKHNNIDYYPINVKQVLKQDENDVDNVKTYMKLRKKIESSMKADIVLLYIDYNEYYEFMDDIIKDVAKINKVDLNIIICEPFSVEGVKKSNIITKIENVYECYKIYKIDCTVNFSNDITINQIFQRRSEIVLEKIENIALNS